jgi:transcriptional regulator with XRE-family HTH domain
MDPMDPVRLGLAVRALRRRGGWTQGELGHRVGISASAISRIERGRAAAATLGLVERVASAVGARLSIQILWQGEALDRLLDAEHAVLVDWLLAYLRARRWEATPEVTFQIRGERGSIDVLARHPNGQLLVVEVKTVIPDAQSMLAALDRKARLSSAIAAERGWPMPASVSRILVVPADRTARRRIAALRATFAAVLPADSRAVRRWLVAPTGTLAGILFVPHVTHTATRHRVGRARRLPRAQGTAQPARDGATLPPPANPPAP